MFWAATSDVMLVWCCSDGELMLLTASVGVGQSTWQHSCDYADMIFLMHVTDLIGKIEFNVVTCYLNKYKIVIRRCSLFVSHQSVLMMMIVAIINQSIVILLSSIMGCCNCSRDMVMDDCKERF